MGSYLKGVLLKLLLTKSKKMAHKIDLDGVLISGEGDLKAQRTLCFETV